MVCIRAPLRGDGCRLNTCAMPERFDHCLKQTFSGHRGNSLPPKLVFQMALT